MVVYGQMQQHYFCGDYQSGLLKYENNTWTPVKIDIPLSQTDPITSIFSMGNETFITTLKNGLFTLTNGHLEKINSPVLDQIQKSRIYAAQPINNNWIAIATNNNGVYIIDKSGKLIQQFSKKKDYKIIMY